MTDWNQAACLNADPDAFVPDDGATVWPAKIMCSRCSIKQACREFGLTVPIGPHMGVYGGLSEQERRKVRRGELTPEAVDERDAPVIEAGGWRAYHERLREQRRAGSRGAVGVRSSRDGSAKRCSACREWKHESEFYSDASRWDGCTARCRACHNTGRRVTKGAA